MRARNKLSGDITVGTVYATEFDISAEMIERFAQLTGDQSSLHTNEAFARRSMYRGNIIHGMLPVMFIAVLPPCRPKETMATFHKISASFIQPIFVNNRLLIQATVSRVWEEEDQVELEYTLTRARAGTVLTTGKCIVVYDECVTRQNHEDRQDLSVAGQNMILDSLEEKDLLFDQISKGEQESFQFVVSQMQACEMYEILTAGLLSDTRLESSIWRTNCNAANLLSTCLFSTFVGMCMPGKYATFMGFNVTFDKTIEWGRKYTFTGKVGFKSRSVFTIVENVHIHSSDDDPEPWATGTIDVKVNEPPATMPSLDLLKNDGLDLHLKDKVVLITGSSRGIGETTAKLLSLYGAKVVVNYFQGKEDAARVVREIVNNGGDAIAVRADVSDRHQVKQAVSVVCKKYGTVHILVNNAVRDFYPKPFLESTWDDFQKDLDIILKGAFNCCQEVLQLMKNNKGGKIINISTVATDNPPPNQTKYVVSKSALVGLTRSLAVEFAPLNIQINLVVPSIVETDLTRHISKMFLENERNNTPMQRNATPADVAKAVVFLSSSLSSFTTGQRIMVTGGNQPLL